MMPVYVPPEQLIKDRAEFARKGISRGRPIVAMEYADGVVLMGENPSSTLHKIAEIYDRVAFAGVGRFNEFETLRVAGIRYADLKGYSYGRADVTAKGLANAYASTMGQIFTHEVKPYEAEVLVVEVGDEVGETALYRVQFDGTLRHETSFGAIGGNDESLMERLEAGYEASMSLSVAIALAAQTIEGVEEREVATGDWEAAVLDRNLERRQFHRLSTDEVAAARA
jgi:proteasome alpha subunit